VIELLRTNDIVLLTYIEALLKGENIGVLVMDTHMSIMEGSIGAIPRRLLVPAEDEYEARRIMRDAGLGAHLSEGGGDERAGR
jgi:hypothetical protein